MDKVAHTAVGIRGDLLRWARVQQQLTMRWIREQGGPSPAYQSEVEQQKKRWVSSTVLNVWLPLLNVTEPFARGEIPLFFDDPSSCSGLAADVTELIQSGKVTMPEWHSATSYDRVRYMLGAVAKHSRLVPRVVLAHVLGVSVLTLDDIVTGRHPVMQAHMTVLSGLTTLPDTLFKYGPSDNYEYAITPLDWEHFLPAIELARAAGLTPHHLRDIIHNHLLNSQRTSGTQASSTSIDPRHDGTPLSKRLTPHE